MSSRASATAVSSMFVGQVHVSIYSICSYIYIKRCSECDLCATWLNPTISLQAVAGSLQLFESKKNLKLTSSISSLDMGFSDRRKVIE